MKNGYILSIDQKCSGSEVLIFDMEGNVRSRACVETACSCDKTGWIAQEAEAICSSAMRAIADALTAANVSPGAVRVIGVTNESDAVMLWERSGSRPLGLSHLRQGDRRVLYPNELRSRRALRLVGETTGLTVDPCCFAGFNLSWLLDAMPDLRGRAERNEIACGTLDSWLVYRLTGGRKHVTDRSNALRTRLYNPFIESWNRQLLELLGIPSTLLPYVRPLSEGYGVTDPRAFFGARGIPVAGIAAHQKEALFG
jgi:glycerol kinase